jgi:hypothetical protein
MKARKVLKRKLSRKSIIIILSIFAIVITALVVLGFSTFAGTVRKSQYIKVANLQTSADNIVFDYSIAPHKSCDGKYIDNYWVKIYDGATEVERRLLTANPGKGLLATFDLQSTAVIMKPSKTYRVAIVPFSDPCKNNYAGEMTVFFVKTQQAGQVERRDQEPNYNATTIPKTGPNAVYAKKNNTGAKVKTIQTLLNQNDKTLLLVVDGKFGPKTEAAVKKYQKSKKLNQTGVVTNALYLELKMDAAVKGYRETIKLHQNYGGPANR